MRQHQLAILHGVGLPTIVLNKCIRKIFQRGSSTLQKRVNRRTKRILCSAELIVAQPKHQQRPRDWRPHPLVLAELLELQVNFAEMTPAVQDGMDDVPCIRMIQCQRESCACVNANAMDRYTLHRCTLRRGYDGRENAWNRNNWGRCTQSHLSGHGYGNGDSSDP